MQHIVPSAFARMDAHPAYTDLMKSRASDPLRLDVAAFAADGGELDGMWTARELPRFFDGQTPPQDVSPPPVQWSARGERRATAGGDDQTWLHLRVRARAWLCCQRCLQPFDQPLDIDRWLRFVPDEAQAETLDAESEDDVLALPRWLDLRELATDELLLALPIVPRHDRCPTPLMGLDAATAALAPRDNPFAVLRSLKRDDDQGSESG